MEQVSINKDILLSEHLASPSEAALSQMSELNGVRLSPHFTLGEVCKTKHKTADGNIPSHVAIENLTRICRDWVEDLRYSYNMQYGEEPAAATREGQAPLCSASSAQDGASPCVSPNEVPVIITSGYRSPEVNKLAGGSATSNHLTGCAVDIRCMGKEQMIRYASILLDIADGTQRDFDELLFEQRGSVCWLHFAVRPKENRRRISFDIK